jgi:aspartyl-tRNA(Asn)/glutamyl-tRNA(Gln) amidotransferase subunit C
LQSSSEKYELIERLGRLAMLELDEAEKSRLAEELERMIDFIRVIEEVDTEGMEPLVHPSGAYGLLRDDIVSTAMNREDALKHVPSCRDGYVTAPSPFKSAQKKGSKDQS